MDVVITAVVAGLTSIIASVSTLFVAYGKLRRSITKDKSSLHDQVIEGYKSLLKEVREELECQRADHKSARQDLVKELAKARADSSTEKARERDFFAAQLQGIATSYKASLKEAREVAQREARTHSEAIVQFLIQNTQEHKGIIEMIEKLRSTVEGMAK